MRKEAAGLTVGSLTGPATRLRGQRERCALRPSGRISLRALQTLVMTLAVFTILWSTALAAQAAQIVNSAWLIGNGELLSSSFVTVTSVERTPAEIIFLQYAPTNPAADEIPVSTTAYRTGSAEDDPFADLSAPQLIDGTTIDINRSLSLVETEYYHQGAPIFIQVTDQDQNLDPTRAETLVITLTADGTGDTEVLILTETGVDTGVFTGYIQSTGEVSSDYDGILSVAQDHTIEARYTDKVDNTDVATAAAMVDPLGLVFDSSTGTPIDGAQITLIDVTTGLPATVYGDDGVSSFPATVYSGQPVSDESGNLYTPPAGGFRFPLVAPGTYRYEIVPPNGYSAPSTVATEELQTLPGAPFAIVDGSRGEDFVISPGPAIRIDIPLDPRSTGLWIRKSANKTQAAIGDFILWKITVENQDNGGIARTVSVNDILPSSFSYQAGSSRIDGIAGDDPEISADGRTLTYTLGDLAVGANVEISYVTEVTAGTTSGYHTNQAVATGADDLVSNTASAKVLIREEFLRSEALLMGRVMIAGCDAEDTELEGLKDARIYLEDGSFVITDERGNYHFEGIEPGTHVVQLDTDSLPTAYEATLCEANNQFAGRTFSQFIDLQGGTMWRADFHVQRKEGYQPETTTEAPVDATAAELSGSRVGSENAILSPVDGEVLSTSISTVRINLDSRLKPRLIVDGEEIPKERIGFSMADPESKHTIYTYIGVNFGAAGTHQVRLEGIGPFGNARYKQELTVYRSGQIAEIRVIDTTGNIADGVTPIRVKLQLRDENGKDIQSATELELVDGNLKPYRPQSEADLPTRNDNYVTVDAQGYALFQPTQDSGRYRATLAFDDRNIEMETYVQPQLRDWIMVGFAEGTLGYNTLSGNSDSLKEAGIEDHLYEDGQVKFFAKGAIKGEWLLTLAYDSERNNGDAETLQQIIDPDAYYPLYGDETQQKYDAPSARKLYVKLERDQFYAMFGDMQTDLTETELSRYSRSLNGFKSGLETEHFAYTLFVAQTRQAFNRDEIRGDGTSGTYHLSTGDLVINSEEIVIETRDRYRSEVIINSESMQRYVDYTIDYNDGTLFFKRPISSSDDDFNPIFIVARYETKASDSSELNYGGRAAVKLFDQKLEVGASHIHEQAGTDKGDLTGLDATVKLGEHTELRVEGATTQTEDDEGKAHGNAWLVELEHTSDKLEGKAYFRQQDGGFGLGQQSDDESGTRKYGLEGSYQLNDNTTLSALTWHEDNLDTGAKRDVLELDATYELERLALNGGLRGARDDLGDGDTRTSLQLLAGAEWTSANDKLVLSIDHEQALVGKDENSDYPTLTSLGAEYRLSRNISLFAEQEFTWGDLKETEGTRAGIKATPWRGGTTETTLERQLDENGERIFALFGLGQTWQLNQNWSFDANLDRSYTIVDEGNYDFDSATATTHGSDEDYTAVSLGATYQQDDWSWANRFEVHHSDSQDKYNLLSELVGELSEGISASARYTGYITKSSSSDNLENELRLGLAYRPLESRWIILDRLDVEYDRLSSSTETDTSWRIVNNMHANYKVNRRWQIAPYYGLKYVSDNFSGDTYSGFTDLFALETRYNLTDRWDLGLHGSILHSWNSQQFEFSSGASIGYQVMTNFWVSLGYNFSGFRDDDFSVANYTAQGAFLKFRFKFDQHSVREALDWLRQD